MDDFLKNIKSKFTVENVLSKENTKEPIVNRDEDIRRTIGKIEPNDIIDVEEIAAKLNEIHEQSKTALEDLKNQSNHVIDSAKSQSSKLIESAKTGFGVLQKTPSPKTEALDEEGDPYTADGPKQETLIVDPADIITKLDEIQAKSWNALDELMVQSNKIIDSAKFQSNQIIESALNNLNVVENTSNQNIVDGNDPADKIMSFC